MDELDLFEKAKYSALLWATMVKTFKLEFFRIFVLHRRDLIGNQWFLVYVVSSCTFDSFDFFSFMLF